VSKKLVGPTKKQTGKQVAKFVIPVGSGNDEDIEDSDKDSDVGGSDELN
jgi:hypothetical protein